MPREKLPDRRIHWTQKCKIGGSSFFLTIGEYPDGRPGEIWIEAHKMGTFARGVLDALARMASVALQNGSPVEEIVKTFQGMHFPPEGTIQGEYTQVLEVTSVVDWIAQELTNVYLRKPDPQIEEKAAGYTPEKWRSGV